MSSLLPEHWKVCARREPKRHTPSNISKDIFLKTELRESEEQRLWIITLRSALMQCVGQILDRFPVREHGNRRSKYFL